MNFFEGFLKNTQISNFMKILLVEPRFFMRTDRHDVGKGLFCNFVNAPKYDFKRRDYHLIGATPNTGSEENQQGTKPYIQ